MIGRLLQPKAEQRPDIVSVLASFPQQRMVCMKLEDLYIENYNCKRREGEHNRKFEELHLKLAQKEQELRRACAAPSRAPTALAHPDAFPAPATPTALERIKVAALPPTARHAHCTMQVRNVKEVDPTSSMLNQVLPSLSSPLSSLLFILSPTSGSVSGLQDGSDIAAAARRSAATEGRVRQNGTNSAAYLNYRLTNYANTGYLIMPVPG